MKHNHNPVQDIPPVTVDKRALKITLGDKKFTLIQCYLCPVCGEPVTAYWQADDKHRTTSDVVGRALRDSGFGGYRFFETVAGQGFEYDALHDPRKKHQHAKEREKSYATYRRDAAYEILWLPFIKLNPIFSINEFLTRCIGSYGQETQQFIASQTQALEFIEAMRKFPDAFKLVEDICNHGKPLFFFNLIVWDTKTADMYSTDSKKTVLEAWFGDLMKYIVVE